MSRRYTNKSDYFEVSSKAKEFMVKKPLIFSNDGLLKSGVIVRHLVLPQGISESKKILDWFKDFKDCAYLNIMSQYTPQINAPDELNRRLTAEEYDAVVNYAESIGIRNAYIQDGESASESFIPEFK
jgi:putative pyruvate formate lyase activating enzyme